MGHTIYAYFERSITRPPFETSTSVRFGLRPRDMWMESQLSSLFQPPDIPIIQFSKVENLCCFRIVVVYQTPLSFTCRLPSRVSCTFSSLEPYFLDSRRSSTLRDSQFKL